jgi:amino acid adenylation domain-containing protein
MGEIVQRHGTLSPEKQSQPEQQSKTNNSALKFFPLSPAQQRLWLLDQLEPGNPGYQIPTSWHLHGLLDVRALEHSLNVIIQRHEVLRASFAVMQEYPIQVIAPVLHLSLPVIDLTALPTAEEREAEAQRQAALEAQHSFNLAQGPLIRAALLHLNATEHILLLTIHHIIADGWSVGVIARELTALYPAFIADGASGTSVQLPDLPIQYGDYAVWQRKLLESGELDEQVEYWKQQLKDAPVLLELPTDYPRPVAQTYRGASEFVLLPPGLARELHALSRREGATLFMVLLALLTILLSRYSGEEDILVGSPFANREQAEVEDLVGFFLSMLVLRTNLSGNPTFRDLLARVRTVCLDAYEHLDVSFDHLIAVLNPERHLSHNPLFQVFLNLINIQDLPTQTLEWPGLSVELRMPLEEPAKFDLVFYVQELSTGIQVQLVYNADLFSPARMQELLAQFRHLASQVVTHPEERMAQFSLVTPQAQAVLPDPTAPLSTAWEGSVQMLFAQQAQRVPNHLAALDEYGWWSYGELNARCNQLANYLLAQDIQRQDVVAIYAHRGVPLIWAILGTLKAGAAYLILDPAYPPLRLVEYLQQANVRGFLQLEAAGAPPLALEEALASISCRIQLPSYQPGSCSALADSPTTAPGVEVGPDDLACISFTSGSTGRPKGILQLHGSLTHFLPLQQQAFGLKEDDRYSMLSGLSHDPLQRDIFTPLCLGASVCVPSAEGITTPGWLAEWMRHEQISISTLTPPMLRLLVQTSSADSTIPSLRWAFIVGDMLTRHDVSELRRLAPSVTCVNMYGTTETQRASGYYIIPDQIGDARRSSLARETAQPAKEMIPVGRGLKDAQLLVLNRAQHLAGISEVGEIVFRSPHLARGYLADDELTRERFITNPFTHAPYDRVYKAGDLGRYRPDGTIDYLGRNDHQVKIRGFRIELGEIEALLRLHPLVQEVVVVDREVVRRNEMPLPANKGASEGLERARAERILVAYVVPSQVQPENDSLKHQLWQFLSARLPSYMVPTAFMVLESLPFLPNRKVDREALPPPTLTGFGEAMADADPPTPTEEALMHLWAEVLGVEQVGRHDNFFLLGGHSLLATQLMAQLLDSFQVSLPLRTLFEAPTLAAFAARLDQLAAQPSSTSSSSTVPLARGARFGRSAPRLADSQ